MTKIQSMREFCLFCLLVGAVMIRRPQSEQQQLQQQDNANQTAIVTTPTLLVPQQQQQQGSKTASSSSSSSSALLTVREMKEQMRLPCNFVHDGLYLSESNEILNQVYQSLMELDDDIVPVVVECGGHDGITKSQSLKTSECLAMNTLLIEASPQNFHVLKQTRARDITVNAALCDGESIQMMEAVENSGETHVAGAGQKGVTANCTSIDKELDKLKATLPDHQKDKLKLVFLVLDIEGHEAFAINGIDQYSPQKVFMETKLLSAPDKAKINNWATKHKLTKIREHDQDTCYNFHPMIRDKPDHLKKLLYGARASIPRNSYKTSEVKQAYMFYGQ